MDSNPLPHERKDKASSSVPVVSSPDSGFCGFKFGQQERIGTPQSSRSGDIDGLCEISRVESYDKLVESRVLFFNRIGVAI